MIRAYTFYVELVFEPSFQTLSVQIDYECENPESITAGNLPEDFVEYILQNISIVAHDYEEV